MPKGKQRSSVPGVWYEVGGLAGVTLCTVMLAGMLGLSRGVVVRAIVDGLRALFGVGGYGLLAFGLLISTALIFKKDKLRLPRAAAGFALAFLAFIGFAHLSAPPESEFEPAICNAKGGFVGGALVFVLRRTVDDVGAYIVLVAIVLCALLIAARDMLNTVPMQVSAAIKLKSQQFKLWWKARQQAKAKLRAARLADVKAGTKDERREAKGKSQVARSDDDGKEVVEKVKPAPPPAQAATPAPPEPDETLFPPTEPTLTAPAKGKKRREERPVLPEHYEKIIAILDKPTPSDIVDSQTDSERGIRLVEDTLASFKIEAKVVNVRKGPVVTRYEVQPAPGIRINRIVNLADDLALALAAIDVRVEAPVPGKSVIGIEVPNKRIALVRIREIIELEEFKNAPSKLTFSLGKDIAGTPKFGDLARMPHLLIAGATNSGKSVCLNSLIVSILSRAHPDEVKFSLIDPKRVELTLYNGTPHLLHPVVVDAKGAARALRGAIAEMERRFALFADKGVRSIETYNANLDEDEEPLYHIVIVIDELADLMMQAPAEFERLICRIAQMARATGIHLVIATQRPSVNVITGVIKANIPSRIAFAVASQVDSRTIIDVNGAERLIGRGDMLYYPIDAAKPVRIQGAFVGEAELNRVVEVLIREYGEPDEYPLDISAEEDEDVIRRFQSEKRDALFEQAVEIVRRKGYASASMLQRELEIGYPRAGKIIDQMERAGLIGPQEGSKPRKVLIPLLEGAEQPSDVDIDLLTGSDAEGQ